ncbi:MAG: RHS repeat protein [Clostridia bacterium]|nr:RHS repeat protein [Clostridia bacterium]
MLALETLFLALAGIYLIYRVSKSTTFRLNWPTWFETCLMRGLIGVALARLLALGLRRWETLAALGMTLVYGMVYRNSSYAFLLFLAILTVGFIGIDHRKIFRMYLVTVGAFYVVTLLAGLMGVITNYVTTRAGRGVRSAWGMSYYTDFASLGLFILMGVWVACRKLPDWTMLLFCAGFVFLSAHIAHSNTSTFCAGLLFCAVIWHGVERRFVDRKPGLGWMKKGPELFALFGFPLLALVMFALMLMYAKGTGIGYRLNTMLSNRLLRGVEAWKSYGLKPFGTPFEQHGAGFSTFPSNIYNFVDSTYPLVLLRYGWVTLLMLCLSWGLTAWRARRCGDRRLLLIMGIIAVHAFSEHHFTDAHFNLLVTMPLAAYLPQADGVATEGSKPSPSRRNAMLAWTITGLLVATAAFLAAPVALSRLKTALELMQYGHGRHALRLICVLGGALFGVGLAAWAVSGILRAFLERNALRTCMPALVALALCVLVGGGAWLYMGRVIDRTPDEATQAVEDDRQALEIAVRAATGRVHSAVLPELYSRRIDGMSLAAYFEDDMARLHGDTVLMPTDSEHGAFIDNGFLYVPVSDAHALYTGDRAVVEALASAGYPATGYYSGIQSVDMERAAELNELAYDAATGARLAGTDGSMRRGPWQDLFGGQYTATWQLSLPEGASQSEGKLCTLSVTTYKGDEVILEKAIRVEQFDADGRLSVSVPFKLRDSRNVGFEVWMEPGATLDVLGISFVQTPDYDVHAFYDSRLRKTRDEYYDADGAPMLRKDGWFACDYEYDRYGNVTSLRYYNCQGQPTMIRAGYAQRRRVYNAKKQVIREAYYGVDGEMVMATAGYAALEREYDSNGNATVERYFGTDGEPLVIADGYAEVHRAYNDEKQVVREAYYGPDGAPMALAEGYSGVMLGYDGAGNVVLRRFLDAEGKPMTLKDGYAQISRSFDGQHQVIREAYLDLSGEPALCAGGFASSVREYDEAGNVIVQRYYGLEEEPVLTTSGYAVVRRDYNALGQVVTERYYGTDERPIPLTFGQYGVEIGYDDVGNRASLRYLDAEGKLMVNNRGYAEYRRAYNARRQIVREAYFGMNGEPVLSDKGYAAVERTYDGKGKLIARRYYDIDGAVVREELLD